MSKNIYDPSCFYKGLRFYTRIGFSCYFRNIEYRGWENVPTKDAVIFAPNHQCAIIDAFAVLLWQKDPVVFMARADIFQNKTAAKLLSIIKMMPIYRIRDGYENLGKNEDLFEKACQVLTTQHTLCLMPEGNQGNQRHLRPLVKGLFRIAFHAQNELPEGEDVNIVPVGIDYTDYIHSGGDLSLTFGKPIKVSDYMEHYRQNQAEAYNELRRVLSGRISSIIQDVRDTDHYEDIYRLSYWMLPAYIKRYAIANTPGSRLDARKDITRRLENIIQNAPATWQAILNSSSHLRAIEGNVSDWLDFIEHKYSPIASLLWQTLLWIVSLPGRVLNWPLLALLQSILKKVKDTQMHSTFRIVMAILILPLFYLIWTIVFSVIFRASFIQALMIFLWCGLAGLLAEKIRPYSRKYFQRIKYLFGKNRQQYQVWQKEFERFGKMSDDFFNNND